VDASLTHPVYYKSGAAEQGSKKTDELLFELHQLVTRQEKNDPSVIILEFSFDPELAWQLRPNPATVRLYSRHSTAIKSWSSRNKFHRIVSTYSTALELSTTGRGEDSSSREVRPEAYPTDNQGLDRQTKRPPHRKVTTPTLCAFQRLRLWLEREPKVRGRPRVLPEGKRIGHADT
jgi:hypothetical protein